MSLLTKITLLNLLLALLAFGIGGVRVYHKFRYEVQRETDFTLRESLDELEHTVQSGVPAEGLQTHLMRVTPIDTIRPADTRFVFADTLAMHPVLHRLEMFRQLTTARKIGGQNYRIMIMNVVIEQSDISRISKNVVSDLFVVLGSILLVFNFLFSFWLLRPFQGTLEKIKRFSLTSGEIPRFPATSTSEFRRLNTFLTDMLHKVRTDYRNLKEFSENASHELQTPLAVASGKLELLLESPGLDNAQLQLVQEAQQALNQLSKLGETLLLLTKIENQEFAPQTPVDFSAVLRAETQIFEELAGLKGLRFDADIQPDVHLRLDGGLARILVSNLLKNAIRHNIDSGWISVRLEAHQLLIQNSGVEPPVPTAQLFERFQKSHPSAKSLGLGLSIVKKICEVHLLNVQYAYAEGVHAISVRF